MANIIRNTMERNMINMERNTINTMISLKMSIIKR